MKKVLVSWIATGHDFTRPSKDSTEFSVNKNGPHFSLYQDWGDDFDIHYLLSQYDENENIEANLKAQRLVGKLRSEFQKEVHLRYMGIDDVLSIGQLKNCIEHLVKFQLGEMDVQVFVSPGTPSMQTAWYLLGCDLYRRKNITFYRRRERRFIKNGRIPPKEIIKFDVSKYAGVINIRDTNVSSRKNYLKPLISKSYEESYSRGIQLAGNDKTTVLITGELGTGKTFLADYIHSESNRKQKPIAKINCNAFREDILENKLFGYDKGAFVGATQLTTGIFEQVKGGTIVLEHIDKLSIRLQHQIASVLTQKVFQRLGSNRNITLDARLIATTTKDLYALCGKNLFSKSLYYRLAVAELQLPSFIELSRKERKDWVKYFMEILYTKLQVDYIENISNEAWNFMLNYPFSGNLKEVANMVEVFYTFCEKEITLDDIPKQMIRYDETSDLKLENVIKKHVQFVTSKCNGNIKQSSEYLGISKNTVRKYLK